MITRIFLLSLLFVNLFLSEIEAEVYFKKVRGTSGYFRVGMLKNRYVFITPENLPFFSIGVCHLTPEGFYSPVLKYSPFSTQKERAKYSEKYIEKFFKTGYIIEYHWYCYMDEPKEGRFDGENSNFGLVDEKDELYKVLTDSLKKINKKIEGEILCLKK